MSLIINKLMTIGENFKKIQKITEDVVLCYYGIRIREKTFEKDMKSA